MSGWDTVAILNAVQQIDCKVINLEKCCQQVQSEIDNLQNEINQLGVTINNQQTQINDLGEKINNLQNEINQLGESINNLQNEINQLGVTINNQQTEINNLGDSINNLQNEINQLGVTINNMQTTINDLGQSIININNEITTINNEINNLKECCEDVKSDITNINNQITTINEQITNIYNILKTQNTKLLATISNRTIAHPSPTTTFTYHNGTPIIYTSKLTENNITLNSATGEIVFLKAGTYLIDFNISLKPTTFTYDIGVSLDGLPTPVTLYFTPNTQNPFFVRQLYGITVPTDNVSCTLKFLLNDDDSIETNTSRNAIYLKIDSYVGTIVI